jgi:phospholipid/cholesterol/gamma-HCH transport system substrate-binding protein
MKQTRVVEFGTGMFVLLGFASLFFLILKTTDVQSDLRGETYQVLARFENVGDLKLRAPVTMAGVTIGRVTGISFDSDRLDAQVTMRISANFDRIPDDTDASILTAGLIGGQYIGLSPGFSETYLAEKSEIQITHSALVLENLIGKFLVKLGGE